MNEFLEIAKAAAREAGQLQLEKRGHAQNIEFKGDINLVTEVDRACEAAIVERIRAHHPDHQILAEESGLHKSSSTYKWIVDPLDGTTNFAHGYPLFCVSIALEIEGRIQMGVIYEPNLGEMFEAVRGNGAFLNGEKIQVSQASSLNESLLSTGFAYNIRETEHTNLDHFGDFLMRSRAVRRDGVAAVDLAYVACGRYDGFWELNLWPWDVAAGSLLVEEAGGKMSLFNGAPSDIYAKQIVASNATIHDEMIGVLRERQK